MAALFQVDKSGISRHIKNIFNSGELTIDSVVANFATTAADEKEYQIEYYNLERELEETSVVKEYLTTESDGKSYNTIKPLWII